MGDPGLPDRQKTGPAARFPTYIQWPSQLMGCQSKTLSGKVRAG